MRTFFDRELDTVATFWRVYRRDGTLFAFTSHDRDLTFDGKVHRAAPGMVPAAIRLTSDLSDDSAEVEGALSHSSISETDLAAGLFDSALIEVGAVAWETLEHHVVYSGQLGRIKDDRLGFSAELRSAKRALEEDLVPQTSPTCRAEFCGPGCGLSERLFSSADTLAEIDLDLNRVRLAQAAGLDFVDGKLRFLAGPQTGIVFLIVSSEGDWFTLDRSLVAGADIGTKIELREGCDHTLETCSSRFDNALNFRGEPFLPGNDVLARYGRASG